MIAKDEKEIDYNKSIIKSVDFLEEIVYCMIF